VELTDDISGKSDSESNKFVRGTSSGHYLTMYYFRMCHEQRLLPPATNLRIHVKHQKFSSPAKDISNNIKTLTNNKVLSMLMQFSHDLSLCTNRVQDAPRGGTAEYVSLN